jgi:hypothetical protein
LGALVWFLARPPTETVKLRTRVHRKHPG